MTEAMSNNNMRIKKHYDPKKIRRRNIFRNVMTVFNILLLLAAVVLAVFILTGCSKEPENCPEAEALVAQKLDEIKTADYSSKTLDAFTQKTVKGEYDGAMLEGYVKKLQEFDYEITGSSKTDKNTATVHVKINTYDFGNEYLKSWNEHMKMSEEQRWQSQFYSFLLIKLASVTDKSYENEADVVCTDPEGDGNWQTDLKDNKALMNAISGGMLYEIERLAEEGEVMDETEVNN